MPTFIRYTKFAAREILTLAALVLFAYFLAVVVGVAMGFLEP